MKVIPTHKKPTSIPDYYLYYLNWLARAEETGDNYALNEAYRLAHLAEEFGLAIIEDEDTMEDLLQDN